MRNTNKHTPQKAVAKSLSFALHGVVFNAARPKSPLPDWRNVTVWALNASGGPNWGKKTKRDKKLMRNVHFHGKLIRADYRPSNQPGREVAIKGDFYTFVAASLKGFFARLREINYRDSDATLASTKLHLFTSVL